ncbi:MAG: HDOD domain-containing protein [Sedimentisphaerales bacterium]|nr:HDOD domain-containing protein [Sedimentisphaerales bacterium]
MSDAQEFTRSKSKKIELVIQQLNSLPTLPSVAARLLQITVRSDTQAKEVVQLIESDPSLASKIITLSSRISRVNRQSVSVSKAVVLLGFETVRNAVLSIKVFETLGEGKGREAGGFDREGFWKHSLAVACAAKMLIKKIDPKVDPEEAFLCGLLHDMGKVALDSCLPKSYARVVELTESSLGNIAEFEQRILGIDHTVVGKRLAEKWNLPESISETVWLHQQPMDMLPEAVKNRSIVKAVHLADVLAREQRIGYSGNYGLFETAEELAEKLNCEGVIDETARELRKEITDRADLLGLNDVSSEELYYEAMGQANRELGHLNMRLQQQNENLQRRSVYFNLLSEMNGSLRVRQSVVDVCGLIAELWQRHLLSSNCAVYASSQDDMMIEGAIKLQNEIDASVFLVDRTDDPEADLSRQAGQGRSIGFAVSRVGQDYGWFFEQVAPMFAMDRTMVIPLWNGEDLVGGILWEESEQQRDYEKELQEIKAVASGAGLAIRQAQKQESQQQLSEQLAQSNQSLQELQRELLQKRTMAAVGEMACGAAHEMNNPLAVIVGRSELLASTEEDDQRKDILERIATCGQELSQIISDLLEFAKPALPRPEPVDLRMLLQKAAQMQATRTAKENVKIEIELEENLPDVFVDQSQVVQAINEVLVNSIDSYQGQGGVVRLIGRYAELSGEVILEVIDEGCGMTEETVQKALSPFFSLKQAGRNRGLGLSRSSRYVEENGGRLQMHSELGKGSTTKIVLPVSRILEKQTVS